MLFFTISAFIMAILAFIVFFVTFEEWKPLTEKEISGRLETIIEKLSEEIRINNFAFGSKAPQFITIKDSYQQYEEKCSKLRRYDYVVYALDDEIRNIALAVSRYKIEIMKLDPDRQFYIELTNIQKELILLSKQARIIRL